MDRRGLARDLAICVAGGLITLVIAHLLGYLWKRQLFNVILAVMVGGAVFGILKAYRADRRGDMRAFQLWCWFGFGYCCLAMAILLALPPTVNGTKP